MVGDGGRGVAVLTSVAGVVKVWGGGWHGRLVACGEGRRGAGLRGGGGTAERQSEGTVSQWGRWGPGRLDAEWHSVGSRAQKGLSEGAGRRGMEGQTGASGGAHGTICLTAGGNAAPALTITGVLWAQRSLATGRNAEGFAYVTVD